MDGRKAAQARYFRIPGGVYNVTKNRSSNILSDMLLQIKKCHTSSLSSTKVMVVVGAVVVVVVVEAIRIRPKSNMI